MYVYVFFKFVFDRKIGFKISISICQSFNSRLDSTLSIEMIVLLKNKKCLPSAVGSVTK